MVLPLLEILFALVLIAIAIALLLLSKNFLVNVVTGVAALLVLNLLADWAKYPTIKIAITLLTVIVSGVLGLAGVGLLILLKLLGIVIQ